MDKLLSSVIFFCFIAVFKAYWLNQPSMALALK